MAKQTINVGSQSNDGTGDTLRTGAQKVNSTINEIYNDLGNGTNLQINISGNFTQGQVLRSDGTNFIPATLNYTDISNRPTIPQPPVQTDWNQSDINALDYIKNKPGITTTLSTLTDVDITAPSVGQTIRWNGNGWINQSVEESSVEALTDLTDVTITSPQSGHVVKFDGVGFSNGFLSYSSLTGAPVLSDVALSGSYDDLNDAPALSTVALSGSYNDLTNKPTVPPLSAAPFTQSHSTSNGNPYLVGDIVYYNGNVYKAKANNDAILPTSASYWDNLGSGSRIQLDYLDLTNKPNLSTVAITGSYDDLEDKPSSFLPARTDVSATTTSLANGASANLTITGFRSYALLKLQTSAAAWVTLYVDTNSRSNDTAREETTDPQPGSGVVAEAITTGSQTILFTPSTIGFNNDSTPTQNIYAKVVNKSGSTAAITVTLSIIQLEL
jgi:hypothetical protein